MTFTGRQCFDDSNQIFVSAISARPIAPSRPLRVIDDNEIRDHCNVISTVLISGMFDNVLMESSDRCCHLGSLVCSKKLIHEQWNVKPHRCTTLHNVTRMCHHLNCHMLLSRQHASETQPRHHTLKLK